MLKKDNIFILKKYFLLIKTNVDIYQKTNKRGKVINFSQHIFGSVKLKCAEVCIWFATATFLEGRLRYR